MEHRWHTDTLSRTRRSIARIRPRFSVPGTIGPIKNQDRCLSWINPYTEFRRGAQRRVGCRPDAVSAASDPRCRCVQELFTHQRVLRRYKCSWLVLVPTEFSPKYGGGRVCVGRRYSAAPQQSYWARVSLWPFKHYYPALSTSPRVKPTEQMLSVEENAS